MGGRGTGGSGDGGLTRGVKETMQVTAFPKSPRLHDEAHLSRVRELPCCVAGDDCIGIIQAHHRTGAGLALKDSDLATMPLCARHHREFECSQGQFAAWDKSLKHDWQDAMIAWTQRRLGVAEVSEAKAGEQDATVGVREVKPMPKPEWATEDTNGDWSWLNSMKCSALAKGATSVASEYWQRVAAVSDAMLAELGGEK